MKKPKNTDTTKKASKSADHAFGAMFKNLASYPKKEETNKDVDNFKDTRLRPGYVLVKCADSVGNLNNHAPFIYRPIEVCVGEVVSYNLSKAASFAGQIKRGTSLLLDYTAIKLIEKGKLKSEGVCFALCHSADVLGVLK